MNKKIKLNTRRYNRVCRNIIHAGNSKYHTEILRIIRGNHISKNRKLSDIKLNSDQVIEYQLLNFFYKNYHQNMRNQVEKNYKIYVYIFLSK